MIDLLQETVKLHNLPFTILLLVVVVYWLIASIGLVDLDGGVADADVDLDVDVDLDMDIDADLDVDTDFELSDHASGLTSNGLLKFAGLGEAPLIFILSLLALFLWATNFLANYYINPEGSLKTAFLLLIPVLIVSFILARLSIKPFAPLMKYIRSKEPVAQIAGSIGKVESGKLDHEFGRITVDFDGRPQLIRAVLTDQHEPLQKGAQVLVIQKQTDSDVYLVRPYDNEEN